MYNSGIVDVSHRYPKMYVVRPQFFVPLITLLRNAALNAMKYKSELGARQKAVDGVWVRWRVAGGEGAEHGLFQDLPSLYQIAQS